MPKTEEDTAREIMDSLDGFSPFASYLDNSTLSNVKDYIDTGSKMFNAVISGSIYGGVPQGRVTLLAGESGVGKSLMAMKIIANAQKKGLYTILVDTENAIDAKTAVSLGADPSKIKYFPGKTVEQIKNGLYELMTKIEKAEMFGKFVVVIDSLANALSEIEMTRMDRKSAASDTGTIPRSIKSLLKMCTVMGAYTGTTFICTNHIYDNPNEMYPDLVKNMTGGKACRYIPSVVVQIAKRNVKNTEYNGDKDTTALSKGVSGIEMRCMCVKNRFIRSLVEGSLYLSWKSGLDEEYGMLTLANDLGVIVRRGSVYDLWDGTSLGYAKSFKKNKQIWNEKIYPELEKRLASEWGYSNENEFNESEDAKIESELLNEED